MTTLELQSLIEAHPLFAQAFTHKSISASCNFERLEFLGDSLIEAHITEALYLEFPEKTEGDLSRWRSALVSQESLAQACRLWKLETFLKAQGQKDLAQNPRIQASLLEAFLGAVYLAQGVLTFKEKAQSLFGDQIKNAEEIFSKQDPKTLLQEKIQEKFSLTPEYETLKKEGPSHQPTFVVALKIGDEVVEKAQGSSLKEAQKKVAEKHLKKWKEV